MTVKVRADLERRTKLLSPRLGSLARRLRGGETMALEQFWREVADQGTPLVEPLADSETEVLVTFLWRAEKPVKEVLLLSSLSEREDRESPLSRLLATDLWYKTYRVRHDLHVAYRFLIDGVSCIDQHNPLTSFVPGDKVSPFGSDMQFSLLRLPDAAPLPWVTPWPDRPSGQVSQHPFYSSLHGNMYRVWVYTPPGYVQRTAPYPLLFFLDGWSYLRGLRVPTILDNLIDVGALPPVVAVMLGHLDRETRGRELPFCGTFLEVVVQELLPWIRLHYHVTRDSAQTVVGGLGLSGVTAALLALHHPDLFGNVLAQSGLFQWKLPGDTEHERLARLVVSSPAVPVCFHLDAGLLETQPTPDGGPSLLVSNRHLRQLLQAKGYRVHYEEFNGGHDYTCWQETLVDGLLALLKGIG